jgi:hypothetical protein
VAAAVVVLRLMRCSLPFWVRSTPLNLVELSMTERRDRAVLEVRAQVSVTEMATLV